MKENGRETQQPEIIREWATKEINPQEIANALGGVLEKSADDEFGLDIHLYYGEPKPVLTLKCNPDRRSIFLGVNAASDITNKSYVSTTVLEDIDELRFVESVAEVPGGTTTDMIVSVRDSGSGLHRGGMIVSKVVSKHVYRARF